MADSQHPRPTMRTELQGATYSAGPCRHSTNHRRVALRRGSLLHSQGTTHLAGANPDGDKSVINWLRSLDAILTAEAVRIRHLDIKGGLCSKTCHSQLGFSADKFCKDGSAITAHDSSE